MPTDEHSITPSSRRFAVTVVNIMHGLGHVNIQGIPILYPVLRDHFAFGYIGIAFLTLVSQMITISDVFDAMPSEHSHKGTKPLEKIVWVLNKGKGTSFNPQLVDHFLRLIKK